MSERRLQRQLVRGWQMIRLLQTGRFTVDQLARELSTTSRTIYRDLAAIEAAHLPVRRHVIEDEVPRYSFGAKL